MRVHDASRTQRPFVVTSSVSLGDNRVVVYGVRIIPGKGAVGLMGLIMWRVRESFDMEHLRGSQ